MFANGRWNDAKAICQFVDYSTGRTLFLQTGYVAPDLDLLPSETTARHALVWLDHIAHNLPRQPADFVNRPMLGARLRTLLTDRQHRLITLRGGGGMGKTALALHALWEFIEAGEPFGYDFVLWFSARDIDLLESGPRERLRDVSDVDDVAESFAQLMGEEQLVGQDAVSYMVDQVSDRDGGPSYLIVLDNLETFESPARIQRVLDESVVLPSKVLLTSRHEEFRGDYPIEVAGMEETEADRLMVEEARRHYAEPRVDRQVRDKIAAATGSRAYAMKLAVAQIGQGLSPRGSHPEHSNTFGLAGRAVRSVVRATFRRWTLSVPDAGRCRAFCAGASSKGDCHGPWSRLRRRSRRTRRTFAGVERRCGCGTSPPSPHRDGLSPRQD